MAKHLLSILFVAVVPAISVGAVGVQGDRSALRPSVLSNYVGGEMSAVSGAFLTTLSDDLVPSYVEQTLVLSENFSKWVAGSEDEPDDTDIAAADDYMQTAGWTGLMTYQAGGYAYLGYDSEDGPGYLMTPSLDLDDDQGLYVLKVTAKSVNENATSQSLQMWSLDNVSNGIINAHFAGITEEWTECEFLLSGGTSATAIMFYGNSGKILVSSVEVYHLKYPLDSPTITDVEYTDIDKVTVSYEAVDGATSYLAWVETSDDEVIGEVESTETSAVITLTELLSTESYYTVCVVAKNDEAQSYYSGKAMYFDEPGDMSTPVALEATDVSESGFTANWEASTFAAKYIISTEWKHTAAEEETFYYLYEDWSNVPETDDDEETPYIMGSCDQYMSQGGWTCDVMFFTSGYGVLTNMFSAYGWPGTLWSPVLDYSVGGGDVTIMMYGMTAVDDMVIGACFVDEDGEEIEGSKQTMEFPAGELTLAYTTISGGTADSQVKLWIEDAASTDMIIIAMLVLQTTLNEGETVEMPYLTKFVDYPSTSCDFEVSLTENDVYRYTVTGYFSDEYMSDESNEIVVQLATDAIQGVKDTTASTVYSENGNVVVKNNGETVAVYTVDGRQIATTAGSSTLLLPKGLYVVKSGNETFKLLNK